MYGVFGREVTKYTGMYCICIRFWPTLLMVNNPFLFSFLFPFATLAFFGGGVSAHSNMLNECLICLQKFWTLRCVSALDFEVWESLGVLRCGRALEF